MKIGMTKPGITFDTGVRNISGILLEKDEVLSLLMVAMILIGGM